MKNHCHGEHMRVNEERFAAADINEKLAVNIRGLGHTMRFMHGGKGGQRRILSILTEEGSITQRELTLRLGIQPGSASEVISKLENAGLLVRETNSDDHRTADLRLTEEGRRQAVEAAREKKRRREEMFSCLNEDEKQTLLALLEKIYADWEKRYRDEKSDTSPR